jgi:hypothetical protein
LLDAVRVSIGCLVAFERDTALSDFIDDVYQRGPYAARQILDTGYHEDVSRDQGKSTKSSSAVRPWSPVPLDVDHVTDRLRHPPPQGEVGSVVETRAPQLPWCSMGVGGFSTF